MLAHKFQRVLVVGLLLVGGLLLAREIVTSNSAPAASVTPKPAETFTIVRAKKRIARGNKIASTDIEAVETGVRPKPGTSKRTSDVAGLFATQEIAPLEPLTDANSAPVYKPATLAGVVPTGMRAISLRLTEEAALADLLHPGDHVDVLLVSNAARAPTPAGRLYPLAAAKMFLQNVPILAVGQSLASDASTKPGNLEITIGVSPRNAVMLALVHASGSQYLALRANGDETLGPSVDVSTGDLGLTDEPKPIAPQSVARPRRPAVEIISGANKRESHASDGANP